MITMDDEKAVEQYFNTNAYWGLLVTVDAKECNPKLIRSSEMIKLFVNNLCDLIEMKRFGECQVVHFGEDEKVSGYSMSQLIETSLISGHFANLTNNAYIDIFSCKYFSPKKVYEYVKEFFEAKDHKLNVIFRT